MSHENVEVVETLLRTFNQGDYEAAFELIDPRVEWHDPAGIPGGGVHRGHDGVKRWFARWLAAWDHFASDPLKLIDAGDYVIVVERMRGRGRHSEVEVDQLVVAAYKVRAGKVVERTDHADEAEALKAVGVPESDA